MSKIITIVIPSYNADKFLKKSTTSLLDKRILSDIEILIVDDGSTDQTALIADGFEKKYPNTIKAIHKENGGHGSTINTGISVATGKYFCTLDADDWMDTEAFVMLVSKLKDTDSDLILFDFDYVNENGDILRHKEFKKIPKENTIKIDKYLVKIPVLKNNEWLSIHNYCIKTNILFNNNVKLHEHHYYVDQEYILYSLLYVKTVTYFPITVRKYLYGYAEQSSSVISKQKNYRQYKEVMEYLTEFYCKHLGELTHNQKIYYSRHIAWFNTGLYSTFLSFDDTKNKKNELISFDHWLKTSSMDIYKANRNIAVFALRITKFSFFGLGAVLYKKIFVK